MLSCFTTATTKAIPLHVIPKNNYSSWLEQQTSYTKQWLQTTHFRAETGNFRLIANADGNLSQVVCIAETNDVWSIGNLALALPEGTYKLNKEILEYTQLAIGWGLGAYQFTRYKKTKESAAQLFLPAECDQHHIENVVQSIYLVRDWINTPTDDMGPTEFSQEVALLAKQYGAKIQQIIGDDLLKQNFSAIHTVGRASDDAPRLIDLHWGNSHHPKLTLVGKGVCFDTGGLDIKSTPYMALMKKDMGGAAHTLGLARMIMQAKLPIQLRVLIPLVENSISGNAYRPGDIIRSRKGLTIEVGNTDAEGRLVLADALTFAVEDKPDLIIDIATLTGAARVALGTELPAMFSNKDDLAKTLMQYGECESDYVWHMPLFKLYRDLINSNIADINNDASSSYGGAITAALFLKEFVPDEIPWLHFDVMAWNLKTRPGRPQGGEAMGLRTLFSYLKEWAK